MEVMPLTFCVFVPLKGVNHLILKFKLSERDYFIHLILFKCPLMCMLDSFSRALHMEILFDNGRC